ncbi:MAG: trypsin-like peptidase domain-containing protein [Rickettsiales bacterium]
MKLSKFFKFKLYILSYLNLIVFINNTNIYSNPINTNIDKVIQNENLNNKNIDNNQDANTLNLNSSNIINNLTIEDNVIKNYKKNASLCNKDNLNNFTTQELSDKLLQVSASIKAYKQENYFKVNEVKFFNNFLKSKLLDNDLFNQDSLVMGSGVFIDLEKKLYANFFEANTITNQEFLNNFYAQLENQNINNKKQYLLTNYHIVENSSNIFLQLYKNPNLNLKANILTFNKQLDLSLLEFEHDAKLSTIEFDLAKDTGQDILLLGSPFGLDFTIAKGIISYKDRVINSSANINFNNNAINSNNNTNIDNTSIEDHQIKYLQIDSLINHGNSGGPIFNYNGKLIGILSGIFAFNNIETGIGLGIPTSSLNYFIDSCSWNGLDFGIEYEDFTLNKKANSNIELNNIKDNPFGIIIKNIEKGSIAEKIGLLQNDRILFYNNKPVYNTKIFNFLTHNAKANDVITLEVMRQDKVVTLKSEIPAVSINNYVEYKGIKFANITTNLLNKYKFNNKNDNNLKGIIVIEVPSTFPGNLLKEGYIVTAINKKDIKNLDDLNASIKELEKSKDKINAVFNIRDAAGTGTISFFNNKISKSDNSQDKKNSSQGYKFQYTSESSSESK